MGYGGFDTADVIIEAVFESMALKKDVLAQLDAVARPGALLATNTSTLDIDAIAGGDDAARGGHRHCTSSAPPT